MCGNICKNCSSKKRYKDLLEDYRYSTTVPIRLMKDPDFTLVEVPFYRFGLIGVKHIPSGTVEYGYYLEATFTALMHNLFYTNWGRKQMNQKVLDSIDTPKKEEVNKPVEPLKIEHTVLEGEVLIANTDQMTLGQILEAIKCKS